MENHRALEGKELAFSGRLISMTRSEAVERVQKQGGRCVALPGASTALLVAGPALGHLNPQGGMARNLVKFRELKDRGSPIRLVEETEFLRLLGADDELAELSQLYTAAQVARIVETPLTEIRAWQRHGLLQPARMTNRLAWFEYRDILLARNLSRLAAAGVANSELRRGLGQIARWLPDAQRILGRLDAAAAGLRVRLSDGSWAEPSGQRLLEFDAPTPAAASGAARGAARGAAISDFPADGQDARLAMARALEAEEAGDLGAAAAAYRRALQTAPDAITHFNLGNALYELGQEADAAESYLAAIGLDQDFAEAWNNLGNSLAAVGKLEDATQAYGRALRLEPDYPDAHYNLALVLTHMGRPDEAAPHHAAYAKAFPSKTRLKLLRESFQDDD